MNNMDFIQKHINTIINADCLDVMRKMPDKCVDLVLTDPPFNIVTSGGGLAKTRDHFNKINGYSNPKADWCSADILDEYVRVCKKVNIFVFGSKQELFKLISYAVDNGYIYHIIPLLKHNPLPVTKNTWLNNEYGVHICAERILCTLNYHDKIPYYLMPTNFGRETNHPNEKPVMFLRQIIRNLTNPDNTVFDPFSGSASTAIACYREKRNYMGTEISSDYWQASVMRLENEQKQLKLGF